MRLLCCGTGAGSFTAERASSGYILQSGGHTIMLDCGAGALRNAMQFGVSPADIEAIFISHLHFDHMLDLGVLSFLHAYNREWQMPVIYGPPGLAEIASRIATLETPGRLTAALGEIVELETGDRREVAGFEVWSEETPHAHGSKSFARRFAADGRSLVFSGDTEANPELFARLALETDLLLHECYSMDALRRYAEGRPPEVVARVMTAIPQVHCEVGEAAKVACAAKAGRLVLTHILRTEDPQALGNAAAEVYEGKISVAYDGLDVEF